jgi:hypothetical protein
MHFQVSFTFQSRECIKVWRIKMLEKSRWFLETAIDTVFNHFTAFAFASGGEGKIC